MKSYEKDIYNLIHGIKPVEEKVEEVKEEEQVDEAMAGAIHPMALHVKPVQKDGKPMYQVHAVGKKLGGGIKKGEHLSDTELDDATEMGAKIKHMKEDEEQVDEMSSKMKMKLGLYNKKSKNEEAEEVDEARFKKGQDVGQPGMNFKKIAASAAKRYGSKEAGQRVAGAVLKKVLAKEEVEVEEEVDFTIIDHKGFEVQLPESLNYNDYLTAAKKYTEKDEEAVAIADQFFKEQDESLVIEAFTRGDVEAKINAHIKAGHQVGLPKYSTKDGKPYAEYTVTNKETGQKTKYIHHGTTRRVERM